MDNREAYLILTTSGLPFIIICVLLQTWWQWKESSALLKSSLTQTRLQRGQNGKGNISGLCCTRHGCLLVNNHIICRKNSRQIRSVLHGDNQDVGEITALHWDNVQYPLYVNTVYCCIHKCNLEFKHGKKKTKSINCFPNLFLLGSVERWGNGMSPFCLPKQNLTFFFGLQHHILNKRIVKPAALRLHLCWLWKVHQQALAAHL